MGTGRWPWAALMRLDTVWQVGGISAPPSPISDLKRSEEHCTFISGDVGGSVLLCRSEFNPRGE